MIKGIKNNKGFTLIELLAVIVIMGILMIVAIPAITRYITQSRRDTFVDTAKSYINAVRYMYLNDELSCNTSGTGTSYYVKVNPSMLEKGGLSPWGSSEITAYVQIVPPTKSDGKTTYKFSGTDKNGHGISELIAEEDLKRENVKVSKAGNPTTPNGTVCTVNSTTY